MLPSAALLLTCLCLSSVTGSEMTEYFADELSTDGIAIGHHHEQHGHLVTGGTPMDDHQHHKHLVTEDSSMAGHQDHKLLVTESMAGHQHRMHQAIEATAMAGHQHHATGDTPMADHQHHKQQATEDTPMADHKHQEDTPMADHQHHKQQATEDTPMAGHQHHQQLKASMVDPAKGGDGGGMPKDLLMAGHQHEMPMDMGMVDHQHQKHQMPKDKPMTGHHDMHKDHMDMDDMDHHNMSDMGMMMYFHFGVKETVLFKDWKITTDWGMIASMIGIFIMGMLYEGLKYLREFLFKRYVSSIQFSTVAVTGEGGRVTQVHKVEKHRMISIPHALQTALHIVQIILSYFLMLIFMTYNVWLCLSVVLGAGVGYFVFGWKKASVVDITEHCH